MCAYTTVEPTNLKPRFFKSLLNKSEISVVALTSFRVFGLLSIGFPSTNPQIYLENQEKELKLYFLNYAINS